MKEERERDGEREEGKTRVTCVMHSCKSRDIEDYTDDAIYKKACCCFPSQGELIVEEEENRKEEENRGEEERGKRKDRNGKCVSGKRLIHFRFPCIEKERE